MSHSTEFNKGAAVGYAMYVPEVFRGALRHHDFRVGDTIYDTPAAYDCWSDALKRIRVCLTVTEATPGPEGRVTVAILRPNKWRSAIVLSEKRTVTQREFIRMLRQGDSPSQA
jgi:hypothetical protein